MTAPRPGEERQPTTTTSNGSKPHSSSSSSSRNVRVVSRIRPLAKYELEKGCEPVVVKVPKLINDGGPETLQITDKANPGASDKRWFELDAIMDVNSTQEDVYVNSGASEAISEDLFSGFNCTILAYGQTGAGKTFTMGTANSKSYGAIQESDGLIPRACHDLFETIKTKCDSNAHVELSYLEVYNEEIRDLLNPQPQGGANNNQLRIRETLNGEVYVRGLQARTVANPADVGKLMEEAGSRRVVASTKMNAVSSRSHAICVLRIQGVLEDSTKFQSKLTLVDLAGSERIKKTEAKGSRAQEGISINKGLFVLGQVVSALSEQRPKFKRKPPFRDSKLTRLLQDSLGGNSRTIMIACCSPADFNIEETINTLRYATQARNIKNAATANVIKQISQEEAAKLQRENQLLKQEIEELQATITKLTATVTVEDLERSRSLIHTEQQHSMRQLSMSMRSSSNHNSGGGVPPPASPPPTTTKKSPSGEEQQAPSSPESEHPSPDNSEAGDMVSPMIHQKPKIKNMRSLDSHFGEQVSLNPLDLGEPDETSLALGDVFPGQVVPAAHNNPNAPKKSYEELEQENMQLSSRLRQAQGDMRATLHDSAIEMPALKVRIMMLEDELNESHMIEQETLALKQELEEAKADKDSAQLAAKQLSDFMENLKNETGFRGDEIQKKRMWYFHKRLDEKWVQFVVTMMASFKEQMRLLGDYFEMVVRVVESPDILTMLGPSHGKRKGGGWFGGGIAREKEIAEEQNLRHRLLTEHIKFFNARLLEIEDEIGNRSEAVDAILDTIGTERQEMEQQLDEREFFHDIFSKKGEKLLQRMTTLMTGPLFSLPLMSGGNNDASSR